MDKRPVIVCFRQDLRIDDHPALADAASSGRPVIPVYIWTPGEAGAWAPGAASRWWLGRSLTALSEALGHLGSRLVVRSGPALDVLLDIHRESGADRVVWNERYEPAGRERDAAVKRKLEAAGAAVETFRSSLLFAPEEMRTKSGGPFKVFTPFWEACLAVRDRPGAVDAPTQLKAPEAWPESTPLEGLELGSGGSPGLSDTWTPGIHGAAERLQAFTAGPWASYRDDRDRPDIEGVSRLSPHLHFGEISVRRVWEAVSERIRRTRSDDARKNGDAYLRQLGWREFAHHLLFHFPHTTDRPLRPEFENFEWRVDRKGITAWQEGRTGYPIVDAGMRELRHTGWIHNRVRLVVASFLVKDLLIHWREGAKWFWQTLVDADLANNTLGWQWTAGCGADAAPFFRIFNPVLQGKKFDPDGTYVRRWVPGLGKLDAKWIHHPWDAPEDALSEAGIRLGDDYPRPIVDHSFARERALEALERTKKSGKRAPTRKPRGRK
jgi:deoxyribodipyrimidine photo-lyase